MATLPPRSVAVTGSTSGIGAAIARQLARDGWHVIGVDRVEAQDAPHLAAQITADLSDPDQIAQATALLQGVAGLVHAAGLMRTGALDAVSVDDGDVMWAVHVRALTLLMQALCPAMGAGGRVVAIGSRTSRGAAGKGQYAATKAAMVALIRSFAAELAPRGITANIVAPAATATGMLQRADRADVPPVLPPIGRFIEPDEIAAAVAFLLSPEAGALTGQEIVICGGASL